MPALRALNPCQSVKSASNLLRCRFLTTASGPDGQTPVFWRFSRFFASFTASPHRPTPASLKFTSSPRRPSRSPHRFTSTPGRLTRAPLELTLTPSRLTPAPHRPSPSPPKLIRAPHRLTPTPDRLPRSPHRPAPAPHELASARDRLTFARRKFARAHRRPGSGHGAFTRFVFRLQFRNFSLFLSRHPVKSRRARNAHQTTRRRAIAR